MERAIPEAFGFEGLIIDSKRQSILDAERHCLVLGGPGSGKTTLALMKAKSSVRDGLDRGQAVLFLSFSRAAVARISEAAKIGLEPESRALLTIQTFHSFFWQLIQGYSYLLGLPRPASIVLAHDEKAMREGINEMSPLWPKWAQERQRMAFEEGRVCFDLFAPVALELVTRSETIRGRLCSKYPLILVDEAQDTAEEQWRILSLLAGRSQLVVLADPEQMIYDFLPGVGPDRVARIRVDLDPLEIDLKAENHRSPRTEIAEFARDILTGRVRGAPYRGVSRLRYQASSEKRDNAIRKGVGLLSKRVKESSGAPAESVAILSSYGHGVPIISAALQRTPTILHRVHFDEAFTLLAARIAAFLLEPRPGGEAASETASLLDLVASAYRSEGTATAARLAERCSNYAARSREGTVPRYRVAQAALRLIEMSTTVAWSGNPDVDWTRVKQEMRTVDDSSFQRLATALNYLVAFARGGRIRDGLSDLWLRSGTYRGARSTLDAALAQEQILGGGDQQKGIHVLNMHKCKGKQFDGVVIIRNQFSSPFVWRNEPPPHSRSRRLLHMAISRARTHVLILDEVTSACPILDPHEL